MNIQWPLAKFSFIEDVNYFIKNTGVLNFYISTIIEIKMVSKPQKAEKDFNINQEHNIKKLC